MDRVDRYCGVALVQQYQVVQHAPDAIEVRLVVKRTLGTDQQAALARIIQDALGHPFRLSLHCFADAIPPCSGRQIRGVHPYMRLSHLLPLFGVALVAACASFPSPDERRQQASVLAQRQHWQALQLQAGIFRVQAYAPSARSEELTIYLEGDGFAWLNSRQSSADPTPLDPIALLLALAQPSGNAAYLGRPCQYLDADREPCQKRYWTDARFAEEVVHSLDQAAEQLKVRAGAQRLVLIGYSGGGALALLLAARREDVARVITVAGNLDHAAWTRHHRVTPLQDSLNPADLRPALAMRQQVHLVGSLDRVIPPELAAAFVAGYPAGNHALVKVMEGYDHHCCWADNWAQLWRQNTKP
jgi:dienelactone hydrolase